MKRVLYLSMILGLFAVGSAGCGSGSDNGTATGTGNTTGGTGAENPSPDVDQDGVLNEADNCSNTANRPQDDHDGDGQGDLCDPDFLSVSGKKAESLFYTKLDASGNAFAVGTFDSAAIALGDFALVNPGASSTFFIAKFDPAGKLLWVQSVVGSSQEFIDQILVDKGGNLIVKGYFQGASMSLSGYSLTNPTPGTKSYFISQLKGGDGSLVWMNQIQGVDPGTLQLVLDPSDQVLLGGSFTVLELKVLHLPSQASSTISGPSSQKDLFVCKLNADGTLAWGVQGYTSGPLFNAGPEKPLVQILSDSSGNVLIAGHFNIDFFHFSRFDTNTLLFDLTNSNLNNIATDRQEAFVVKLGSEGSLDWVRQVHGDKDDEIRELVLNSSDRVIINGKFVSSALRFTNVLSNPPSPVLLKNNASPGQPNGFVAQLNSDGSGGWIDLIFGTGNNLDVNTVPDPQGNIALYGRADGIALNLNGQFFQKTNDPSDYDHFIAKLNGTSGANLWIQLFSGESEDRLGKVLNDSSGNVFAKVDLISTTLNVERIGLPAASTSISNTAPGKTDALILKIGGADGAVNWVRQWGGSETEVVLGMLLDGSDSLVLDSALSSQTAFWTDPQTNHNFVFVVNTGQVIPNASPNEMIYDGLIAKFSPDGGMSWSKQVKGEKTDVFALRALDASGNPVFAGLSSSPAVNFWDQLSLTNISDVGFTDAFLGKLQGGDGAELWVRQIPSSPQEVPSVPVP